MVHSGDHRGHRGAHASLGENDKVSGGAEVDRVRTLITLEIGLSRVGQENCHDEAHCECRLMAIHHDLREVRMCQSRGTVIVLTALHRSANWSAMFTRCWPYHLCPSYCVKKAARKRHRHAQGILTVMFCKGLYRPIGRHKMRALPRPSLLLSRNSRCSQRTTVIEMINPIFFFSVLGSGPSEIRSNVRKSGQHCTFRTRPRMEQSHSDQK